MPSSRSMCPVIMVIRTGASAVILTMLWTFCRVTSLAANVPSWLEHLLKGTKLEIPTLREFLQLQANRRSHDLGR